MGDLQSIFDVNLPYDPTGDFDAFLKRVPARGAIYLLADAGQRPVQLLCVMNLRYSLKRRLGGEEEIGPLDRLSAGPHDRSAVNPTLGSDPPDSPPPGLLDPPAASPVDPLAAIQLVKPRAGSSRRVNYRELVRHIFYTRIDSAFEADWRYYEVARQIFPATYRGMVGFRPAWFVHVDPDAEFPRYTKTIDLTATKGLLMGPFEDKHAAARFIQLIEDAFDLCRYYNILLDSPNGRACAYKEMGKCPAPCDGSISLGQYRRLIEWSAAVAVDPAEHVRQQESRMNAAAAELNFESAQKIKQHIAQLLQFACGPFRHVRLLKDFTYLSLQRGPRAGTARVFLITALGIQEIAGVIATRPHPAELLRLVFALTADACVLRAAIDAIAAERIGVVTHHLFGARQSTGVFLRVDALDEKSVIKGLADLRKQKQKDASTEEGLVKELQAS